MITAITGGTGISDCLWIAGWILGLAGCAMLAQWVERR